MKRRLIVLLVVLGGGFSLSAQSVLDGVYVKEHIPTKKVISYTYLREADVLWEKRVWRIIDLREKINHQLYYPLQPLSDRWSLWSIIKHHIENEPGSLTPYRLFDEEHIADKDDMFRYPVKWDPTADSVYKKTLKTLMCECSEGEPYYRMLDGGIRLDSTDAQGNLVMNPDTKVCDCIESEDIVAWELKEDWFFDKQRSVMDVRIVGISPIVYIKQKDPTTGAETIMGTKNLLWVYFPELRYLIQNYFVYNRKNDAMRMSFDDLFWKRMFNSYVKKESNVFDRMITDYVTGTDALLESEKIKLEMQNIEHDMWDL